MSEDYIAGKCNIGKEQLQKRKRFLIKCIMVTVLFIVVFQWFHFNRTWRIVMIIPFSLTSIGAQQVIYKFCYVFGLKGYYGFGEIGKQLKIEGKDYLELDRKKSRRMIISSVLIGFFLTLIYCLLPV